MSEIGSVADAVFRMEELIPGAESVVSIHKSELSEFGPEPEPLSGVAPYTLFTELRRYIFEDSVSGGKIDDAKLRGLYQFIEEALASSDDSVRDGVLIRIAHKLFRYEGLLESSASKPGPRLAAVLASERTS